MVQTAADSRKVPLRGITFGDGKSAPLPERTATWYVAVIAPPASVLNLFVDAGWTPGRVVAVPAHIEPTHPAFAVLASFGGLQVGKCGSGEECARSDVVFQSLGPGDPEIGIWNGLLGTTLVGVAAFHHSHGELYVSADGRFFGRSSDRDDDFWFHGQDFAAAIEGLLLGRRFRPMLKPDQASVQLYGHTFTRDDPQVYQWMG